MLALHSPQGRLTWLVVLLSFFISTADGCALMTVQRKRDPNEPQAVTWDFRQNNHLANLDPYTLSEFARLKTSATAFEDGIHLTLQLPGNRVFDEDLNAVICFRNGSTGDRVENVTAYFPYMTIREIEQTGSRLIEYWKFDRRNFDDWCRTRRRVIPEDDERFEEVFGTFAGRGENPSLSLEIRHTREKSKPWRIFWEVSWNNRNSSAP